MTNAHFGQSETDVASLVSRPLRFGFVDGHVTEVCGASEDSARDLNLKRGILSAFQTTFDGRYETEQEDEVKKSPPPPSLILCSGKREIVAIFLF